MQFSQPRTIENFIQFSRAYFFNANVPSGVVEFLKQCMPNKPAGEIYSSIGLHKHGKTLFYRILLSILKIVRILLLKPQVPLVLVMLVITLPSYPYVFKIIRDDKNRRKVLPQSISKENIN